jgi:hypothetical protein
MRGYGYAFGPTSARQGSSGQVLAHAGRAVPDHGRHDDRGDVHRGGRGAGKLSATYTRIFDTLMAEAVTGDDARWLITAAAAELAQG